MRVILIVNNQSSSKSVAVLVALRDIDFFSWVNINELTKMRVIPVGSSNIGTERVLERAVWSDRALGNTSGAVHWAGPFLKDTMPVLIGMYNR